MERVDVLVLGATTEGLAAARAAAVGGVRVALVDAEPLLEEDPTLHAVLPGELELIGIEPKNAERSIEKLQVAAQPKTAIGGELVRYVLRADAIIEHIAQTARRQGVELRYGVGSLELSHDAAGWLVKPAEAEPLRAEAIVVADGARSPALLDLGLFDVFRVSESSAGILSYLSATWVLGENAGSYDAIHVLETRGPLGAMWLVPGNHSASVAIGPVWRGVAKPQYDWASQSDRVVPLLLDQAATELRLPNRPVFIDLIETRIDALHAPTTFDRGVAVGTATGHGPRAPLLSCGAMARAGATAGRVLAEAVKTKSVGAAALARAMAEPLAELSEWCPAQLALEARGMRHPRARAL
ncbi:MAG: hypothetical protein HY791_14745 [Deltaproteobacteria bacterium]|nr:hypothetical protein [Deltaproteobacteria bacterium]